MLNSIYSKTTVPVSKFVNIFLLMEESRVSDSLPFPIGTETKAEGTGWGPIKDTEACEDPGWNNPTSERPRHSDRSESENDVACRDCTAEKFCRLEVEAASAAAFSSETCETPRSSERNTGATAGDSTAPSGPDVDTEAGAFTDSELLVGTSGESCCRPEAEEANSVALSSETSECQTGATAGDSTVPSCTDTEADGDHAPPLDVTGKKCCRLESLSRSAETHADAAATAAGDGTVPSLSDADQLPHVEGVPNFHTTGQVPGQHEEPGEVCATELSTMSSEIEEGMGKEVRFGERRPLATMQGNKPASKRLPYVAMSALFDELDVLVDEIAPPTGPRYQLNQLSGLGNWATSRRRAPRFRASILQEPRSQEVAPTDAEVWHSEHFQAKLEAVASRLERVMRSIKWYQSQVLDGSQQAMEDQYKQMFLELGKYLTLPFQQANEELLMRWLLRMRDVLKTDGGGGGGFTELDVQLAIKSARWHLRTARGAAAKLAPEPEGAAAEG